MIELDRAPASPDSMSPGLSSAGAKAVLVGAPSPPALPFDVVESKIHAPAVLPGTVSRTALVNRLRAAGAFPFLLVVAPAGYGKTTLLSQWAHRDARPFAWVSIDERDNDPTVLLRHVAAALARAEPVPSTALGALRPNGERTWAKALPRLAEALASRESPFVLVLDGADVLEGDAASAVGTLVEEVPAGSMIALSGRVLPDLPIAALRAGGPLLEIGPYELAFSRREAEVLIRSAGINPSEVEIDDLVERTEGWAAGLYLAALESRDFHGNENGKPRETLEIRGDDRYLADYFRSEYLSQQTPERLTFLRRTSVLTSMSGPLCDAVLQTRDSGLELAAIEKANLFLVPLDRHRGWYRYHRLFRDLLLRELEEHEPELVPVLNQRAADWYESKGDAESTLDYAYAAGNTDSAAQILSAIAMTVCCGGRVTEVEAWLAGFDDEGQLERYPVVAVNGSRIHALRGRADQAERWLAAAERGVTNAEDGIRTRACFSVVHAVMCADGPKRMLSDAGSALADLPPGHAWHPSALLVQGAAYLLLGDDERAQPVLGAAAEAAERASRTETQALSLGEQSLLATRRDDHDEAEALAQEALHLIEEGGLAGYATSALAIAASARALLRHGQWDEARRQLTIAQRLAPNLTNALPWLAVQVRLELVRAYLTLRDRESALGLLAEVKQIRRLRPDLGVLCDELAKLQIEVEAMPQPTAGGNSGLTRAELRLLPLLSTHLSFREIGERLFVSRNTIKTQAISVYRKLGVSSRSDAIARAAEVGLVEGAPPAPVPLGQDLQSAAS